MDKVLKSLDSKEVFFAYTQMDPSKIDSFCKLVEHHSGIYFRNRGEILALFGHGYLACATCLQFQYLFGGGSKQNYKFLISKRALSLATNPLSNHKQEDLSSTFDFIKAGEIYFSEQVLSEIEQSDIIYKETQIFFHEDKLYSIDQQASFQWNVHKPEESLAKEKLFDFAHVPQDHIDEDSRVKRVLASMKRGEEPLELLYNPADPSLVKARGGTNPKMQAIGFENKSKKKKAPIIDTEFLESPKGLYSTVGIFILMFVIIGLVIGYVRSSMEEKRFQEEVKRDIERSEVLELIRRKPDAKTAQPVPEITGEVAYLMIDSRPSGATVTINGTEMPAKTPTPKIKVKADKPLRIVVSMPDHRSNIKLVNLEPDEEKRLLFELER
ncbi:MAG: PEGA domain-containing protein [Bdellovibrionota bacterium]